VKTYNRLLKFSGEVFEDDRAGDLLALFKADTSLAGKDALRKTMEDVSLIPSTAIKPEIYVRDIDKIQDVMYRYSNWVPAQVNGVPTLGIHPMDGWYVSFDMIDSSAEAKLKFLLPNESTAAYRLEFETVSIKDKAIIPYGMQNTDNVLEPLTRDIPLGANGAGGGGSQLLAKDVEIRLTGVWDISVSPPQRIFPPNP